MAFNVCSETEVKIILQGLIEKLTWNVAQKDALNAKTDVQTFKLRLKAFIKEFNLDEDRVVTEMKKLSNDNADESMVMDDVETKKRFSPSVAIVAKNETQGRKKIYKLCGEVLKIIQTWPGEHNKSDDNDEDLIVTEHEGAAIQNSPLWSPATM